MYGLFLFSMTVLLPIVFLAIYHKLVLKKPYRPKATDIAWIVLAGLLQLANSWLPYWLIENRVVANFIHHAVGGGVVVVILWQVVKRRLWPNMPWKIQFLYLIAVVNVLGNGNEIAELVADTISTHAYSSSQFDTWYDIVANNLGMVVGFCLLVIFSKLRAKRSAPGKVYNRL